MAGEKVLIVEDDAIIGLHIRSSLKRMGYSVLGVVSTGEEAVVQADQFRPDLILMDISLAGSMDGVSAAEAIHKKMSLPIIFLTAFADSQTLRRAKITDPFGYILKPFDERILQISIEMALYKHSMERRLVESEEQLRNLVENQGEGVGIISLEGKFVFVNPALEAIMGVEPGSLVGRIIHEFSSARDFEVLQIQNNDFGKNKKHQFETNILRPTGELRQISVTATAWHNKDGELAGSFAIISDITERKAIAEAERQARNLAEALRDTAAVLNSSLEIDKVLDHILTNVGRVVPHDSAKIVLVEEDAIGFVRTCSSNSEEIDSSDLWLHLPWRKVPIFAQLYLTRRPAVLADIQEIPDFVEYKSLGWMHSYAGAPLFFQGRLIGFLNLTSAAPNFFTAQQADHLLAFANQAAVAIENARLYQETRDRAYFLSMLNEITQVAINAVNEKQTMRLVAEKISKLFHADGAFLTEWDANREVAIPVVGYGYTSENYAARPYKPGGLSLTRSVLQAGRVLGVEDVYHSEFIDPDVAQFFPMISMMGLPLIADGTWFGAVLIGYRKRHHFTREEILNGEQVSSQVALAVAKARLYAQVQLMSITDELTGLFNRRGIFEKGREVLCSAQEKSTPLSLIWLDIDHFKQVNDVYGHHIGDQVVRGIADRCRVSMRERDLVGRYGGEGGDELILLLPDAEITEARQVAERLRQLIADQPIHTEAGPIAVTVSLGVAQMDQPNMDFDALLKMADTAMYTAKSTGRNRIAISEEV
jgi:diguanylate cyclase (GGDEF)-like protein/PAS domain S-box-containing protein